MKHSVGYCSFAGCNLTNEMNWHVFPLLNNGGAEPSLVDRCCNRPIKPKCSQIQGGNEGERKEEKKRHFIVVDCP